MAPTSRSNQPTGPGGTSSGSGGPGGASVEATHKPPTADRVPPPPPPSPGGAGGQRYQSPPPRPTQQQPQQVQYYLTEPLVVYDYRKKKKRGKKYSKGLKTIQRTEDGLTLAGRRLGDAVESGFRSYRKRRNKSARRRKDGPIRDIVRNTAGGLSQFFSVGSDIPYDVAKKVNNRRFGKQVRDTVRFFTAPLGLN
jgi:hypothetical protein